MENKFNAKQCVFILILIVVALYCISWMSGSLDMSSMLGSEQFNGNSNVPVDSSGIDSGTSSKTVSGPSDDDQNDKVSPKTGTSQIVFAKIGESEFRRPEEKKHRDKEKIINIA